jgi:hypothetical protein
MRIAVMVMVALVAGACVVEEPGSELAGVSWSEGDNETQPLAEPNAGWRPSCNHHFKCCHDTKLGTTYDDHNRTRCYSCAIRCDEEGQWPRKTYAGKDCEYWKKGYEIEPPDEECR